MAEPLTPQETDALRDHLRAQALSTSDGTPLWKAAATPRDFFVHADHLGRILLRFDFDTRDGARLRHDLARHANLSVDRYGTYGPLNAFEQWQADADTDAWSIEDLPEEERHTIERTPEEMTDEWHSFFDGEFRATRHEPQSHVIVTCVSLSASEEENHLLETASLPELNYPAAWRAPTSHA